MGTFSFIIRKGKVSGAKIYIQFSYGRRNKKHNLFRSSTGYYVNESKNWDSGKQEIKPLKAEPNHVKWNSNLRDLKSHFIKEFEVLLSEGEGIDNSDLKHIQMSYKPQPAKTMKTDKFDLANLLGEWSSHCATKKRISKGKNRGKKLKKGTIKTIKNTEVSVKEFLKTYKVRNPKYIDDNMYEVFLNYLEGKGLGANTVGKIVKNLKSFFKYLYQDRNERIELPNYFPENWVVFKEEINDIYLTTDELMKLFYLDLTGVKESYHNARELFLISSFTGLRISDNQRLEDKHIIEMEGFKFFKIRSKKTGSDAIIPVAQPVEEILKRNNGLPKKMPDQTLNKLIKEVAQWAGIDDVHIIHRTKGGKQIEEKYYKYELVKSHTGRRSYCTNAYLGGMDAISIMAVSNHTTEENFLNYIKITDEEMALRNAKNSYYRNLSTENYNSDGSLKLRAV